MKRIPLTARPDWRDRVASIGLTYHTHESPTGPQPYWNESAYYEFSSAEVDVLERAFTAVHALLIDVADDVVQRGRWDLLNIPPHAITLIERSWNADDFSLYGRF